MTNDNPDITMTVARLLFQERHFAYAISDTTLHIVEVGGDLSLFSYADENYLGISIYDLVPELIGNEQEMADILSGRLPRVELSWLNRSNEAGNTIYLNLINRPHHDASDQIDGLVHLLEDSTMAGVEGQRLVQQRNELRLLRDQLLRQNQNLASLNAELKRMDEMKSVFVSIAAHELRSPLTSISGYLEMLLDGTFGAIPHNQTDALRIIESSAQRLISITSNLLDATRLEAGRVELVLVPAELLPLVEVVVAEMMPQLEAKEQQFAVAATPNLPPILCDRMRVIQIIANLLNNACKYTPHHGCIYIKLTLCFWQMKAGPFGIVKQGQSGHVVFSLTIKIRAIWHCKTRPPGSSGVQGLRD